MKCFWKAHCVGDIEGGIALLKLARLYERTSEADQAAAAYTQYIKETEGQGIPDRDEQGVAYKFLASYHLRQGELPQVITDSLQKLNRCWTHRFSTSFCFSPRWLDRWRKM